MIRWGRRSDDEAARKEMLHRIAESVHGIEALFDDECRLSWISPSIVRVTGLTPADCLAADDFFALLIHESDQAHSRRMAAQVLEDGQPQDFELRFQRRDREVAWVACHWRRVGPEKDGKWRLRLSAEDIQARKEAEYKLLETVAELRRAQALREHYLARSNDERQRLSALLNLIRLGILFIDQNGRVLYYNRAIIDIWGEQPANENLIGTRECVLQETVRPLLHDPEAYFAHLDEVMRSGNPVSDQYEFSLIDGRILTERCALVEGSQEGHPIGRVWVFEDVTEARRTSARLVELAERDPLTDLYNRRRFHEELERMLAEGERRGTTVGLLSLDLDGFKPVNDVFGHQAGDEVLVGIARRVSAIVRRHEMFFRIGGDEFAMLVPDTDANAVAELAHRLVDAVAGLSFEFEGQSVGVTASIGIALYPGNGGDGEALIAAADEAMYRSKADGRNRWALSDRVGNRSARMPVSNSGSAGRKED